MDRLGYREVTLPRRDAQDARDVIIHNLVAGFEAAAAAEEAGRVPHHQGGGRQRGRGRRGGRL